MMIVKCPLPDDFDPAGTQRPEEARGVADPGEGQHGLAMQCRHRRSVRFEMP